MNRKLKDFINKRVISTAISAAITFNMATLLPVSVFAKADDSAHTNTVDLNEIKVDGKVMSNGYIAFNVENDGHFAIGTTGGNPDNSKDNNKKMLYGYSSGSTSYSTLRIDGSSYTFNSSTNSFNTDEANNVSEATYNDVGIQQVLSLSNNPATGRADMVEVKYVVTNESDTEKNVGLRIMMDTMLGDNDSAPFRIPQYGAVTTETEYTGDEIPQFWQAFDNLTSPSVIAQGRLYQTEEDKPDKVQFCNWRGLSNCNWEYTTHPGSGNGDSGVAMTWYETPLAPYESKEYVTYYGLSEFSEDMSLPLGLSVYSDSELSVVNNQYAPNPVDVTAYIQNLSNNTAEEVKVSIELPDGLQLTNNSEQTIDIGTMTPNQLEQTAWSVFVNPSNEERTYEYTVVLTAADGYEKRVSRKINVPALKVEEVSPYTIFSGSSTENFQLNCWKSTFNGNVYTGAGFVSNASELYLNGKVDAANSIITNGWKINIDERNENAEVVTMPDWDSRIHKMAGAYEYSEDNIVRIEDRNVISGAVKTTGNVEISGTTFDGDCYIIADGDITYNVNNFISTGRVVLYSRSGNIEINGTNIDMNGIIYAPNGTVAFNSNIANINGRIFADKINFSGSIFNVSGSDSDWELLGTKTLISKTYTVDNDFNEGEFNGLGLNIKDELTLDRRSENDTVSAENSYKIDDVANGIDLTVKSDKSSLDKPEDNINLEVDLSGFGSQEIEENNVDLIIAIDESWSMEWYGRMNSAKSAAKEIIAQMKPNDRCAVIGFSWTIHDIQGLTSDKELLYSAIDQITYADGTDITGGIRKSIDIFHSDDLSGQRQKYVMLISDGEDSTNSSVEASKAGEQDIRIFALSIGNDSMQMQTVAANSNGIYLNSPTAEQINEMMQQFAAEVFDTAGKDVSFEMTLSKKANIDTSAISPQPTEIVENEDGTKTLKWNYEKISIDESKKITVPVSVTDLKSGLVNIADNVSCTYFNRNGESSTVYSDDIVMPVHSYKESGTWTTVYDSKTADTVWKNIYWNGKLYDDGKITVRACAGNDENAFGDWIDITNHADIENLSGRYIKLSVEMKVSSTGKTPELFDITLLSDGADKVNFVNNAPQTKIIGSDTTCVSKRLFLSSETMDDAFCTQINFKWSCDNENVIISSPNKPYTSFKFNESGEYEVTLSVSDGNSETIVSQMITVLNDEVMVVPIIDLEIPPIVKAGSSVSGKVNNLNGSQISEYEIKVGNDSASADENGNFTFTAPENDSIISINVKAINALGIYGENSKAIVIDGTAPRVELKSDSDEIHTNDTVTISALMSDENGIKDYSVTLNGEEITLNENYQYIFVPENSGEYVFTLTVKDIVGNISDTTLVLNVSEEEIKDTNQPVVEYSVPKMLMVGESGEFEFISSDDTGVAEFTVAVNGTAVNLDENGRFNFLPEETGDLIIDVHAADEAGNNTDFQLVVPVISFDLITEKTTYKENELVNVQLVYSDNLNIINQQVTIDGVQMTIENDKISVEGLSVGTHQLVWQIQDECGAAFTGILEINIVDSTAPEISVTLSNNNPKEGDTVTAEITAKDEQGVASVTANLDGKEISVIDNKAFLENLSAGKHTLKVTAYDTSGNYAVYTCDFTVFSSQPIDTIAPDLDIAVELTEDKKIEIIAVAVDDSEKVSISGTVNGEEVAFEKNVAVYIPQEIGDYVIVVRAEDESGNYTEKTQTVTITEEDLVFELKLGVNVEKNIIKPNEKTNLIVSTSSMLGEVSLSCTSDGGKITESESGFSFVSDKEGTFEVIVTASDKAGNTASKAVYITVTENDPDIDDEEYVNTIKIEPRARVVLESSERTETKMTEEMAELADQLKTPLAVYEYLYNNLNTEYYIGSRKGAIGTYEQKSGNDVDSSSLLIAMLRYLGYDADYVTGKVTITKAQLMELTATDNLENAEKVYMLLGRPLTRSKDSYILERTWVKAVIDGNEYQLDVNFKKFKPVSGISEEIKAQDFDLDFKDYSTIDDADALFEQYKNQASLTEVNLAGRLLENKKISRFPLTLPYDCNTIIEETHNIIDSSVITSDSIGIMFGNNGQLISSARAYIDPISIQYVPCEDFYDTLGDVLDIEKPANIYVPTSNDYILANQKTICPALYLNNVKVLEWSGARVSIGDKQKMTIVTCTGGQDMRYTESRELIVGSIVSIVIDTQTISPQALLTAYENYKAIKDNINEDNFFETSYCDNYLNLIGNSYFAQLDVQNTVYSSAYDVYKERELSFGLFNYEPIVETKTVIGYQASTKLTKKGHFGLDILGVYNQALSLNGNADDVKSYLFASGYVSSYLESQILQQFTGVKSVSTAEVFRQCNEKGIDLKMISSENKNIIDTLQISSEDKAEITKKVDAGYLVIVPERNITINQWTGTAYIVQSRDGTQNTFIITGDKNGGYSTMDIVAYMMIATIGSGVDMYGMIFGTVSLISFIIATPLLGTAVTIAAAITVTIVFAYMVEKWCEDYQETVDLYFKALEGDADAANKLNSKAFFATVSMFFDFATGGLSGSKGAGPDDVPTPGGRKTNLSNKGYADDVVDDVFKMKNVDSCSDELLESIAKSGKSAEVADTLSDCSDDIIESLNKSADKDTAISLIAKHGDDAVEISAKSSPDTLKSIAKLTDNEANDFFKTASKYTDDLTEQLGKSTNTDDAVEFIAKHSDEGAELFVKNGDMGVEAVNRLDDDSASTFFRTLDEGSDEASEVVEYINGGKSTSISEKDIDNFVSHEIDEIEETALITKSSNADIYQKNGRITELKPNNDYYSGSDINHAQYKYHTDDAGRIESVSGKLERHDGTRNSYAQSHVGRGDRITTKTHPDMDPDDGGHLIATIFNGDGNLDNLVPMNRNLNRGPWESMERDWASLLEKNYNVEVSISVVYPEGSSSLRPEKFIIETLVTDPNTGVEIANEITHFKNVSGQTYNCIKLKY